MHLIFAIVCLVGLLIPTITGLVKKSGKMLGELALIVTSFVGALIGGRALSGVGANFVMNTLLPKMMGKVGISQMPAEASVLTESISVIVRMAIGPILFIILFIVLRAVLGIVKKIVFKTFKIKIPDAPKALGRLCGAAIGLVCGVLCILAIVMPLFGTLDTVQAVMDIGEATEEVAEEPQGGMAGNLSDMVTLNEAPIAKQIYGLGGDAMFTFLTTTSWNGEKVVLREEAVAVVTAIDQISALSAKDVAEYGDEEATALRNVAGSVDDSALLSNMMAGVISEAAGTWSEGNGYLGIRFPGMTGHYGRILKAFFSVFATTDTTTVGADLTTFADVFALLVDHDMFALLDGEDGEGSFASKLTNGEVVGDFYEVLDRNARMQPVKVAIADVGMNVMLGELGGSAGNLREDHGALMNDMASALKASVAGQNGTIDRDTLRADTATAITENAVNVEDSVVDLVVDALVDEFTAQELATLTEDEIVDRMVTRFEGVEN